jgi:hypothetical protein
MTCSGIFASPQTAALFSRYANLGVMHQENNKIAGSLKQILHYLIQIFSICSLA